MEKNKIVMASIGIMICVILIGGLLMPVIDSAIDNEKTIYNNDENGRYSVLYDSELENLNATITAPSLGTALNVTVGEESYSYPIEFGRYSMIMCDKLFIRIESASLEIHTTEGLVRADSITFPLTVSIVNGVVTVSDSASYTITVTPEEWVFIPNMNGKYESVFRTHGSYYLNALDQVYYTTYISTNDLGLVTGNGNTAKYVSTGAPIDIRFIDVETINPYVDLIYVDMLDCQLNPDVAVNSDGTPIIPNIYMVPISVIAHTAQNNTLIGLYSAIPLVAIVSLIVTGIYVAFGRRY